jgi:hypothetical protein
MKTIVQFVCPDILGWIFTVFRPRESMREAGSSSDPRVGRRVIQEDLVNEKASHTSDFLPSKKLPDRVEI